jgi:hypothetical protein
MSETLVGPQAGTPCQQTRAVNWRKWRKTAPSAALIGYSALKFGVLRRERTAQVTVNSLQNVRHNSGGLPSNNAVNKATLGVWKLSIGSPETRSHNFFSQDSLMFLGARDGFELAERLERSLFPPAT